MLSIYKMTFFANFFEMFLEKFFPEFRIHLNVNADSLKAADKLSGKDILSKMSGNS